MSQILKTNFRKNNSFIFEIEDEYRLLFKPGEAADIIIGNGKVVKSACLNCINPMCVNLTECSTSCKDFEQIAHEMNKNVCPVEAITSEENSIQINENKCIGCGLCAMRCPVGAIYIQDGKAQVSTIKNEITKPVQLNSDGAKIQDEFIVRAKEMIHEGCIQQENNAIMDILYDKIKNLNQAKQNILGRNLLISLGNNSTLARQGNVYMRMDGFYNNDSQYGVVEIETGTEMLDVSRALLDDVAVLNARYSVNKDKNHPLAICLGLANRRTDYWQVVKDINKIVNVKINTITFGALLMLAWNFIKIVDFDEFYIDADNSSIRKVIENKLSRKSTITDGYLGILENLK